MPYFSITTNLSPPPETQSKVLNEMSSLLAERLGKSEQYVMASFATNATMVFGRDSSPCAFCQLTSLGMSSDQTADLSQIISQEILTSLGIPPDRIYIQFEAPERSFFGWNGKTFG